MVDAGPDYTDPLEAAVAAELIALRPEIGDEGARAGAHVVVSGVDAAAGTRWPPRLVSYRRARSRVSESADRAVTVGARIIPRRATRVHPWIRKRQTTGLERLDTGELARSAVGAVRAVQPPPQVSAQ
jgi:hypothetical protein